MRLVFFLILALLSSLVLCDLYLHNPRGSNNRFRERRATRSSDNRLFDSQNNARGGYNVGDRSQKGSNNNNNAGENVDEVIYVRPTSATSTSTTASFTSTTYMRNNVETTTPYVHPFIRSARTAANTNIQTGQYDDTEPEALYQMVFLEGSEMDIEWTNQHACGGDEATDPNKMNCALVFQFMCESRPSEPVSGRGLLNVAYPLSPGDERGLHDGYDTQQTNIRILNNNGEQRFTFTQDEGDVTNQRGYHESINYWNHCYSRQRNRGLFNADQAINGASARFTRQNPNGGRNGFECAEERDYYPYWGITPWRDIAVLTNQYNTPGVCQYYKDRSQNSELKYTCHYTGTNLNFNQQTPSQLIPITQTECTSLGGTWTGFKWDSALGAPDCQPAPWSRDNHLGNGRDGNLLKYTWKLPTLDKLPEAFKYTDTDSQYVKCVLRMRYNNTSDDYEQTPFSTLIDRSYNPQNPSGNGQTLAGTKQSPFFPYRANIQQNAQNSYYADIHGHGFDQTNVRNADNNNGPKFMTKDGYLRLAINTAEFGRVFEDRSHTFFIKARPAGRVDGDASKPLWSDVRIVNLNVRGKRCNIVQCYPALEYDFVPHDFNVSSSDFIHVQWTGSNSHTNGNGGNDGDGQAGNDGQGRASTDRHNIVQISDYGLNYPVPLDRQLDNMWSRSTCRNIFGGDLNVAQLNPRQYNNIRNNVAAINCALHLATSGYYGTRQEVATMMHHMQPTLNDAPPSLVGGVLLQFDGVGQTPLYPGQTTASDPVTFKYMSSRNNAFTNRAQKGSITVIP